MEFSAINTDTGGKLIVILYGLLLEPYIRSFRQFTRQSKHSNHRYFIDPRPIGSAPHLWGVFENLLADSYDYSRSLSRSFSPQPLQLTQVRQG